MQFSEQLSLKCDFISCQCKQLIASVKTHTCAVVWYWSLTPLKNSGIGAESEPDVSLVLAGREDSRYVPYTSIIVKMLQSKQIKLYKLMWLSSLPVPPYTCSQEVMPTTVQQNSCGKSHLRVWTLIPGAFWLYIIIS